MSPLSLLSLLSPFRAFRRSLLLICAATMLAVPLAFAAPSHAEDAPDAPMVRLLARIPDSAANRAMPVSYLDYEALIAARPGAGAIHSIADWNQIRDETPGGVWLAAFRGGHSGWSHLGTIFGDPEAIYEASGIDLFTLARSAEFGTVPGLGVILEGAFDAQAIDAALTKRGYTAQTIADAQVWCGPQGCDQGLKQDLKSRDPFFPFGGHLGRQEPVALAGGAGGQSMLFNSTDYLKILGMLDTRAGIPSLADAPDFGAGARVMLKTVGEGAIIQAHFLPPAVIEPSERGQFGSTLPKYDLAFFAHGALPESAGENRILTLVGLVYVTEDAAKAAAGALPVRLNESVSVASSQPVMKLFEMRGGVLEAAAIVQDEPSGRWVVILPFRSAVESATPGDSIPRFRDSGLVYALLVQSFLRRDLAWLWAE